MYKAVDRWLPGYVKSVLARRPFAGTRHLYFAIADHFEPLRGGISQADSRRNVQEWLARYETHFEGIRAADGSRPKQTLFYPAEEYDPAVADMLRGFRDKGLGDVEIHLHHRNDTEDGLREKLVTFRDNLFHQHGLLRLRERDDLTADERRLTPIKTDKKDGSGFPPSADKTHHSLSASIGGHNSSRSAAETTPERCASAEAGASPPEAEGTNSSSSSIGVHRRSSSSVQALRRDVSAVDNSSVLSSAPSDSISYGFVHGNWALCNTRPDGDWCGVDNEIAVLKETGCYADFTFPSAPSPTQPRVVNKLYYAGNKQEVAGGEKKDSRAHRLCSGQAKTQLVPPECLDEGGRAQSEESKDVSAADKRRLTPIDNETKISKDLPLFSSGNIHSENSGKTHSPAEPGSQTLSQQVVGSGLRGSRPGGRAANDSSLLLITGPLCLDFSKRKYGFLPGLENGNIDGANPASPHRADLWAGCGIHAEGRPDRIFVKVHTHGLVPANAGSLFGGSLLDTYRYMLSRYDDGINWKLHFVSCHEMYEAIMTREG